MVNKVTINNNTYQKIKRVVGYARVSTGKDAMLHSLASQVSYFKGYINKQVGWHFVEVYSDEAFTGTKDSRPGFKKMLSDAKDGKFDMIMTKSISRFARNTITLLSAIRELKLLGVDVFFEEQNIHTLSSDGEFMISILASYAQEESLSVSENMNWRIKKNFEEGIPWGAHLLGYKFVNDKLEVIPSEAIIVKRIYQLYLEGKGFNLIAKILNNEGYKTKLDNNFTYSSVSLILKNYTYTGNLLLQKTYRDNHLNKKTKINNGERQMYHATNTHEAIISLETFNQVQELLKSRSHEYVTGKYVPSILKGKVRCGTCGKAYKRLKRRNKFIWLCSTFNTLGKDFCSSSLIPDDILLASVANAIGVKDVNNSNIDLIDYIQVFNDNLLIIHLSDGTFKRITWKHKSRSESWTPEMKEKARLKALEVSYGKK